MKKNILKLQNKLNIEIIMKIIRRMKTQDLLFKKIKSKKLKIKAKKKRNKKVLLMIKIKVKIGMVIIK